jgi:hypothetical protein
MLHKGLERDSDSGERGCEVRNGLSRTVATLLPCQWHPHYAENSPHMGYSESGVNLSLAPRTGQDGKGREEVLLSLTNHVFKIYKNFLNESIF